MSLPLGSGSAWTGRPLLSTAPRYKAFSRSVPISTTLNPRSGYRKSRYCSSPVFGFPLVFGRRSKFPDDCVVVVLRRQPEFGLNDRSVNNSRSVTAASQNAYDDEASYDTHGECRDQEPPDSRFGPAFGSDADDGGRTGLLFRSRADILR